MNLNTIISIERRGTSQDTSGQLKDTWKAGGECWASVRPIAGREFFSASGHRASITHEVVIRYGAIVTPKDRIKANGRLFEVHSVINVFERDRYLKLLVIENAN